MTAPKADGLVKATLGDDNMLVGTVVKADHYGQTHIRCADGVLRVLPAAWSIEVLSPPIPEWLTVPGARAFTDDAVMMRMGGTLKNGDGPWRVLNGPWAWHGWMSDAEVAALDPQPIPPAEKP